MDQQPIVPVKKKSTGKKILKAFMWIFIVIILAGGAVFAWFYFSESGNRDPFTVIPNDAVFVIETNNLTEGWSTLSDSKMWKHLMGNKKFEDINESALSLDSLIKGNETLDMLFSDRKLLISVHMITTDDYDFIFAVDMKKASKITFLKDYIADIVSNFGYSLTNRDFSGTEILILTDLETNEIINIAFVDNVLVCSYSTLLIEKSITQKDSGFWEKNKRFKEVTSDISSKKLFNFYFNYGLLDEYLRCYLSEPSESINSLSKTLSFSAFNVNLEDERLSFSGYTGVIDSVPSYLNALVGVEPGKMKAQTIISDRAALYLAICFNDFNDFFGNLKKQFDAEDTTRAENYDKTIKKVEKYLKVSLEDDFFSWIGNEIAFVKMQPTANAREEDVVVTIHSKDIEAAKKGLAHLTAQIRKKTLGLAKFKDEEYKNYTIRYLGFSGFLKLFFGKLFNSIERPYFTYIEDFVVFSNSPSCLMDVIDDYTMGHTLSKDEKYMNFVENFDSKSNVSIFVQMPKIYSHMYYYSKDEKRRSIKDNKDIILGFTRIGFQLTSEDNKFKTTLMADFDEDAAFNDELEKIESAAEDLFVNQIDTGMFRIKLEGKNIPENGPMKIMYADSIHVKFEGRTVDGKPDGLWRIYYESGKIAGAINYENGMANGVALFYYDNDRQTTLGEANFKDDMIDGMYREFYENGQRKATVNYAEGKPDGEAEFFYDSGLIKIEGRYKMGEKEGKWKHYTETGEVIDKAKWKKGQQKNKAEDED
jgi:antitoxin component YwqK of YwqJK toxin-antitoxin module